MRTEIQTWLKQHCSAGRSTALGAVLLRREDGLHLVACWPDAPALPPRLAEVAGAAVARGQVIHALAHDNASGEPLEVMAHPLEASGALVGAVVVVLRAPQPVPEAVCTALAGSAQAFALALQGPQAAAAVAPAAAAALPAVAEAAGATEPAAVAATPAAVATSATAAGASAERVLQVVQAAFEHRDWRASATVLAATLAAELSCSRVALGFRSGLSTRVEALSHGAALPANGGMHMATAAAMDEAIDDGATIVYPAPEGAVPRIVAAHAHLLRRQGGGSICTVPLAQGQRVAGALLLHRDQPGGFDAAAVALLEAVSRLAGPWLLAQRRAARPWHEQAGRALRRRWRALQQPGGGRYKLAALGLALGLAALLWVPAQREVRGTARLEGTVQRVLAAPGDGYLRQVMVRPGDAVAQGQVLVEFAGEDLQIERSRLQAELAGVQAAAGEAMSLHDRAQLAIHSAKADELAAQLALMDQRIERALMKAPFDAVVIAGDLAQQLGAPVRKGEALLTLAPSQGFRAIVEVDDADIGRVRRGQGGSMVLAARPDLALPLRVLRITPLATQAEGRNVFEIEVDVQAPAGEPLDHLRPGMRGIARLHTGDMPLALAWTSDVAAWVRLAAWRWIG
jgi:hypothetical protein